MKRITYNDGIKLWGLGAVWGVIWDVSVAHVLSEIIEKSLIKSNPLIIPHCFREIIQNFVHEFHQFVEHFEWNNNRSLWNGWHFQRASGGVKQKKKPTKNGKPSDMLTSRHYFPLPVRSERIYKLECTLQSHLCRRQRVFFSPGAAMTDRRLGNGWRDAEKEPTVHWPR